MLSVASYLFPLPVHVGWNGKLIINIDGHVALARAVKKDIIMTYSYLNYIPIDIYFSTGVCSVCRMRDVKTLDEQDFFKYSTTEY